MMSRFDRLSKPEVEQIIGQANFTDEQLQIFKMLCKGKSLEEISLKMSFSRATVSRRINEIKEKVGKNMAKEVPIWEKVALTLDEASAYSNIGINKIRELSNNPTCKFVIFIGNKRLIKRKEFEKYISENVEL